MRRRSLLTALATTFVYACRTSINKEPAEATIKEDDTASVPDDCLQTNLQINLDDHPELLQVGGSATISFDAQFTHLLVVCIAEDQWVAVWKICTHGTCDVEWDSDLSLVRCPCHDSLFDKDGVVLQGPAERDLKSYLVCKDQNILYLSPDEG